MLTKFVTILKSLFVKKKTDEDKIKDFLELTGWLPEVLRRSKSPLATHLLIKWHFVESDVTYLLTNNPNKLLLEATEQYLEREDV